MRRFSPRARTCPAARIAPTEANRFSVSVVPAVLGFSGAAYFAGAVIFGLGFLWFSFEFGRARSAQAARRVLLASVLYLPAVLLLMVIDRTAL